MRKYGIAAVAAIGFASSASASLCPAGTYSATGSSDPSPCIASPPGYYVPTAGATAPIKADPGYYVSQIGSTHQTPAAPGYYVSSAGATTQTKAAPGSYVPGPAATAAIPASPGYYVPTAGATAQIPAAPGTYVSGPGATMPVVAAPGYYVDHAAATTQTIAPLGTYVSGAGATSPTPAPIGTFVGTQGSTIAIMCPTGSTSYGGASACRAGTYAGANSVVGEISASLANGGDFTTGVGGTATTLFTIGDTASAFAVGGGLTDITLLDARIVGGDGVFTLSGFTPGMVLHDGDIASLLVGYTPSHVGSTSATLVIDTDQYAPLGTLGRSFSFDLSGQAVPEPASWAMMVAGFGLAGTALRRRARNVART